MATIRKIPSTVPGKKAHYKALIRRNGRVITSKTFGLKKHAVDWARCIEGDEQALAAFGSAGATLSFSSVAADFRDQWAGKDDIRGKVKFWQKALGDTVLIDITDTHIDAILEEYASGEALCGARVSC